MKRRVILLMLLPILVIGCAIPEMPSKVSWDTEIAVPIAGKTYGLWDIVKSDSALSAEGSGIGMTLPDSALYFSYTKELEPITPLASLRFDPIEHSIENRVQGLRIPLSVQTAQTFSLSAINPDLARRHGFVDNIEPFPVSIVIEVPLSDLFTTACVDSGEIHFTMENTLPFAVSAVQTLWYADRDHAVNLYQGTLPATQTTNESRGLGGSCLAGSMVFEIRGTAVGGSQMLIDSTQGISLSISMGEFIAATYYGQIPRQAMRSDSSYPLEQEHDIYEGKISSGELILTLTNQTQIPDSVTVTLPNLMVGGVPLVLKQMLLPQQTKETTINLANYQLVMPDPLRQEINGTLETVSIESDHPIHYSGGEQIVIASFQTQELSFSRFEGVLHNLETAIERDSSEIEDIPDGWENIHATVLDLRLSVRSRMPAAGVLRLNLFSTSNGMPLGSEERLSELWLGQDTTLLFTGLANLVPSLPDLIGYSGMVVLNGPITADDTMRIGGRVELQAPLLFTVDPTVIPGEAEKVEPEAMDEIQEVILTIKIWNGLPVSGTMRLIAAFDSSAVLENSGQPHETLCTVQLPAPILSGGRVSGEGFSEVEITPPPGSYDFLRYPPFYVRPELTLNGSENDTLAAYGSDHIRLSATARVRYRVSWEN